MKFVAVLLVSVFILQAQGNSIQKESNLMSLDLLKYPD